LTKIGAPDVVRSALDTNGNAAAGGTASGSSGGNKTGKISARTIDKLFGVPDKIHIPERYVPESVN